VVATNWPKHVADLLDSKVVLRLRKHAFSCKFTIWIWGAGDRSRIFKFR
jgi:hypothetical protein